MSVTFRNEEFQHLIDVSTAGHVDEKGLVLEDGRSQLQGFDSGSILLILKLTRATIDNIQKWVKYGFVIFAVLLVVFIGTVAGLLAKCDHRGSSKAPSTKSCSSKAPISTLMDISSLKPLSSIASEINSSKTLSSTVTEISSSKAQSSTVTATSASKALRSTATEIGFSKARSSTASEINFTKTLSSTVTAISSSKARSSTVTAISSSKALSSTATAVSSSKAPSSIVTAISSSKAPSSSVTDISSSNAPSFSETTFYKATFPERRSSKPITSFTTMMSVSQTTVHCPQNYTLYEDGNLCYKFYNRCISWYDSRRVCQQHGGDLLVIQNNNSFAFFREKARHNQGGCAVAGMWIGLTDEPSEGVWTWINGQPLASDITFGPREPNGGRRENCATLFPPKEHFLNDAPCDFNHGAIAFVCSMEPKKY